MERNTSEEQIEEDYHEESGSPQDYNNIKHTGQGQSVYKDEALLGQGGG